MLAKGANGTTEIARRCFEWVADNLQHSADFKRNPVTCSASGVLLNETGALYCLRGFKNLRDYGWYRIDCHGNKPGIDAPFSPPVERLAFQWMFPETENDFSGILREPLPILVAAIGANSTWDEMLCNLPRGGNPTVHAEPNAA